MEFDIWLEDVYKKKNGERISQASVKKYFNAIHTISNEMLRRKIICKSLDKMNLFELDVSIEKILKDEVFLYKDLIGNRMYSCALKRYRCYRFFKKEESDNIDITKFESLGEITEKEVITKNRIGQQNFKKQLLNKYNNKCIITGISLKSVLVASHIKPWAVANDIERIDVNNGFLLSATYDKLFDSGLISFKENGKLIISNVINEKDRKSLNLINGSKYELKMEGKMKEYLKYHNSVIFVS